MSFLMDQDAQQRDYYINTLKSVGALSRLFSESAEPYLYYRLAENIFCKSFEAENLSRTDTSADASKGAIGIGLKTYLQNNKYKLRGQTVYFFNAFDIDNYKYYDFEAMQQLFEMLNLKSVPVLDTNFELIDDIEKLVELSIAKSTLADVHCEGIVIRPLKEKIEGRGRVSFKAINPEFLLKYE